MKLIYCLLSILFIIACTEHTESPSVPLEELPNDVEGLEALLSTSQKDAIKLGAYWKLYKVLRTSDKDKAFDYLEQQQVLASNTGSQEYVGKATYAKGLFLKRDGEFGKALEQYLLAVDAYSKIKSYETLAQVLNNIGSIFSGVEDFSYAIEFFSKASSFYEKEGNNRALVQTYINLGICHLKLQTPDYEKAEYYYTEALKLAETVEVNRNFYFNVIQNMLGFLHYEKGSYDEAIGHYEKSLDYLEGLNDKTVKELIGLYNIGESLSAKGEYKDAESQLAKAIEFGLSNNISDDDMVECYTIMGELMQRQGRHLEATDYLETAITLANKGIINEPLQEAIGMITQSYHMMKTEGTAMDGDYLVELLTYDAQQDALIKAFQEQVKQGGVQEALRKQVAISELEGRLRTAMDEVDTKSILSQLTIGMVFVLLFVAGNGYRKYRTTEQKRLKDQQELEDLRAYKAKSTKESLEFRKTWINNWHERFERIGEKIKSSR